MAALLDTRYADCDRVTLVCDNLNTHTMGAFYEAFEPERASQYVRRLQFCYAPKHGSWLNVAECELSCLTSQCLRGHRIGDLEFLQTEIYIWSEKTTAKQRGVDWQLKVHRGEAAPRLREVDTLIPIGVVSKGSKPGGQHVHQSVVSRVSHPRLQVHTH